ncbi:MAG TPA: DUF1828 domain-containing protein [Longimicrobiales bacterium]
MKNLNREEVVNSLCRFFDSEIDLERQSEGRFIVSTPFTDESGDVIDVYLEELQSGEWILSDGGFVHQEVALLSGQTDPGAAIWRHVEELANEHDIRWGGGELWIPVIRHSDLGAALHHLATVVSKCIQVGKTQLHTPAVHFWEEVEIFFKDAGIPYQRNQQMQGISKVVHSLDFVLRNGQIHAVQAVASELSMRRSLNIFWDIVERNRQVVPVAFIDDSRKGYSNDTFKLLSYKAKVVLWDHRGEFADYWRSVMHDPA